MRVILKTIFSKPATPPVFEGGSHRSELTVIRAPRARAMRLRVDPASATVRLTLPRRANLSDALRWAESKRGWVEEQLARIPAPSPLGPGLLLPFRGSEHRICWSRERPRRPRLDEGLVLVGGPVETLEARLLRWLKAEARILLSSETIEFAELAGVAVGRVGVGDPVSRWGSCSASGNIRFSWRLILAPDFVRRATVAHEVAHRTHMNHSPAFHAHVAELLGEDPAPARDWLRLNGPGLHRIGCRESAA